MANCDDSGGRIKLHHDRWDDKVGVPTLLVAGHISQHSLRAAEVMWWLKHLLIVRTDQDQ